MTNPNSGVPVAMAVPEVLEGLGHLGEEVHALDEHSDPDALSRTVQRLAADVERNAEYGRRLWHQLHDVVTYLREDVAGSGASVLDGDESRRRWAQLYGSTLSLLAGPDGDSGYGEQQAQLELQNHAPAARGADQPA